MKTYLITDPHYYTTTPKTFQEALNRSLIKYTPDFVCFRDKTDGNKTDLLNIFLRETENRHIKRLINGSLKNAVRHSFDGVHLQGSQYGLIAKAKDFGLLVITSCHSAKEALEALSFGSDFITLSPVFDSPGKGVPFGINGFTDILETIDKTKVFALGGIDDNEKAAMVEKLGVFGFASIRYFTK